jgi:tripartite-type tricarboxylate transporter receptor subunit TctC
VAKLVDSAYVLVVNTKTDFKSVQDLINFARTHPDQIHYASSGNGSSQHLMGAMFCAMTNAKLKHVPYRGSAGATTDLLAGVVESSFAGLPNVLSLIQQGKLRALAVTTAKRIEQLPDVPTLSEAGVSGYDASIWLALLAPAGTPPEIVQRLNKDLTRGMTSADASKTMFDVGVSLSLLSPADTGEMMVSEMQRWSKVIRDNGIKPE